MSRPPRRVVVVLLVLLCAVGTGLVVMVNRGEDAPADRTTAQAPEPTEPDVEGALVPAWEAAVPPGEVREVRADDDLVVVAGERSLVALDRATGEQRWRRDVGPWCALSDLSGEDSLVLATSQPVKTGEEPAPCRAVTSFDLVDGAPAWKVAVPPISAGSRDALGVGDTSVTVLGRCDVMRLRLGDGRRLSRDAWQRDDSGDCLFSGDATTDGQVVVDFRADDPNAIDITGALRVRDADTGDVLRRERSGDPVDLGLIGGDPLLLGLWGEGGPTVVDVASGQALVEATEDTVPVHRADGSTYAVTEPDSGNDDRGPIVHRFATDDGTLAWSRALLGRVVTADTHGLTVVGADRWVERGNTDDSDETSSEQSLDVVRMAARDGHRQLLGWIPTDETAGPVVGDASVLLAPVTTEEGPAVRLYELPSGGDHPLVDDGRGGARLGPDDAVGACDGFSDRTMELLGGRRDEVGVRLDCHWYTVSTLDLNIRFETAVSIGDPDWAAREADWLADAESLDDFTVVGGAAPLPRWGDRAWVLERIAARRVAPGPDPASAEDNVIYGLVVAQDEVAVKALASVEVERDGADEVIPADRVRRAVRRAVTEIFASLDVEVARDR